MASEMKSDVEKLFLAETINQGTMQDIVDSTVRRTPDGAVVPQGFWCYIKCGAKIALCATDCIPDPFTDSCKGCLGGAWDDCKSCF